MNPIMEFFVYDHLPPSLQEVSEPISRLADDMDSMLLDGAEKSAGMRKLLEAKDCFVRAKIATDKREKAELAKQNPQPQGEDPLAPPAGPPIYEGSQNLGNIPARDPEAPSSKGRPR